MASPAPARERKSLRPSWLAVQAGDSGDDGSRRSRGASLFWGLIWLVWLAQPFLTAVRHGSLLGAVTIVAFAVVYVWHFFLRGWIFSGADQRNLSPAQRSATAALARDAVMVGLAIVASTVIGQDGAACLVYVGIAAMWTFPRQIGLAVAMVAASTYVTLWHHVAGWRADWGSIIGLCFGVLAVMAGRTAVERQRALSASRVENAQLLVQAERNRMARDLHDILGHSLTVITVKAELAGRLLDAGAADKARAEVADLERLSREALADVRRAVEGYREISLVGELARAREALQAAGIRPELPTAIDEITGDTRELFAWVVREGVTNVLRHSCASVCRVTVAPSRCVVADNCPQSQATIGGPGNGLTGLRERAEAVGFTLRTAASASGYELVVSEGVS